MLTRYHQSKGENRIPQEHKDVFQEPVWSFYHGGTVKFILKKDKYLWCYKIEKNTSVYKREVI